MVGFGAGLVGVRVWVKKNCIHSLQIDGDSMGNGGDIYMETTEYFKCLFVDSNGNSLVPTFLPFKVLNEDQAETFRKYL